MKSLTKFLSLIIVLTLLLTGCSLFKKNPISPATETTVGENDNEAQIRKVFSCDMLQDKNIQQECERRVSENVMQMIYDEALKTFDLARCDLLEEGFIENCKKIITQSEIKIPLTNAEAINLKIAIDGELAKTMGEGEIVEMDCDSLEREDVKIYCKKEVNRSTEREKFNEIIASEDANRCEELTDELIKNDCKETLNPVNEEMSDENVSE